MMSENASGNGRLSPQDALVVLNGIRLSEQSQRETLEMVTDIAKRSLLHSGEASISLVRGDTPWTTAFTGKLAIDLDERQYEQGYGPCLDCARSGQTLLLTDMANETRWPRYTPQALERGCRSSLSVPLPLQQDVTGALNLYSTEPDAFDDDSISFAQSFAGFAATPLVNAAAYENAADLGEQLREAMKSRATIEQAKGILMERHKVTAAQAFDLLVKASQSRNTKLRDVADSLVVTGSLES